MSFSTDYSSRKYCSTPKCGTSLPKLLTAGSTIPKVSLKERRSKKRLVKRTENKSERQTMKKSSIADVSENVILQDSDSECDQQKSHLVDISGGKHSSQKKYNFDNVAENKRISQKFEFDEELRVERLSLEVEDLGIFENAKANLFVANDSKENDIGLFHSLVESSDNLYDTSYRGRSPEQVRTCADETSQNNLLSPINTARRTSHSNDNKGESGDQLIKTYTKAIGINRSKARSYNVSFLISDNENSLSSDEDCERLKYVEPDPSFKSLSVIADMLWDEFMDDEPLIDKHRAVVVTKKDKKQATTAKNRKGKENKKKKHVLSKRNSSIAGSSKGIDIEPIIFRHRENHSLKRHFAPETQTEQEFVTTGIDPYDVGDNMKQVKKVLKCSPRKKPKIISTKVLTKKYRLVTKQQ